MNKTNIALLCLFLASFGFYNCNKNALTGAKPTGIIEDAIKPNCIGCGSIVVKTNPSNSYDTVGARHNAACSYLLGVISPTSPTVKTDILHYTNQYLATYHYDTTKFDTAYNYMIANHFYIMPDSFFEQHPDTLYNSLYAHGLISLTEKNYLFEMDSVVTAYIGGSVPNQAKYDSAANRLITIESSISSSFLIPISQKQPLLCVASIYRYSLAFWGTYINANSFSGYIWRTFGKADANGAIAGCFITILKGGGAILGTLGGGITASMANWVFPPHS